MARFAVTPHAVEQFIARHMPGMRYEEAKQWLEARWGQTTRIKTKSVKGQDQYQLEDSELPSGRCTIVTKIDKGTVVFVTVLPAVELEEGIEPFDHD